MILYYGDTERLQGTTWYTVELCSDKTVESTLKRLCQAIPKLFEEDSMELFIPVHRRGGGVMELTTLNVLFVRSSSFPALLRMRKVNGVLGLMTKGDSNKVCDAIPVEDSYVQSLIADNREQFYGRSSQVMEGSFVRIVDGEMRDYCGIVDVLSEDRAVVRVQLKTKSMFVETPRRNLQTLDEVAPELRVFYYTEALEEIDPELVKPDLFLEEDKMYAPPVGEDAGAPKRFGRQQTVTAYITRMIYEGHTDPKVIARSVMEKLSENVLRMPKDLEALHSLLRRVILKKHFMRLDPTVKNFGEGVEKFGPEFKLPMSYMLSLNKELNIPHEVKHG